MSTMSKTNTNSDISHFSDCVYYDSELRELSQLFKDSYDVLKRIRKRADRHQTQQISKSLFDYVELKKTRSKVPQQFYDFVFDDYRVCIYYWRGYYSVMVVGFDFPYEYRNSDTFGVGTLHGEYKTIEDCFKLFLRAISYLISQIMRLGDLFDEVPF